MKVRRLTIAIIALAITLPLFTASVLIGLASSRAGSLWLVTQISGLSGNAVRIGNFDGRLWGYFEASSVHIDTPRLSAAIEHVSVRWRPRALMMRTLDIDTAVFDGIDLTLRPGQDGNTTNSVTRLPAPPLPITLQQLQLRHLTVHTGDRDYSIDLIRFGAAWDEDNLAMRGGVIEAYDQRLGLAASITSGTTPKLAVDADWTGELAGSPGSTAVQISGPVDNLQFDASVGGVVAARLSGEVDPLADHPDLSARGKVEPHRFQDITLGPTRLEIKSATDTLGVSIATTVAKPGIGSYALSVEIRLRDPRVSDPAIVADIEWHATRTDGIDMAIMGTGTLSYRAAVLEIKHTTAPPYQTGLTGDLDFSTPRPDIDLKLDWTNIRIPLTETLAIVGHKGTAGLFGPADDLKMTFIGDLELPEIGATTVEGNGRVVPGAFFLERCTAKLLDGSLASSARVQWHETVAGDFQFSSSDIDLSKWRAAMPSRLAAQGSGDFQFDRHGPHGHLNLQSLSGFFREQAVSGSAGVKLEPGSVMVERGRFQVGANRIVFDGSWDGRFDGRFDIDFGDLAVLAHGAGGTLSGNGTFSGDPAHPRVDVRLQGRSLTMDRLRAERLDARMDIDTSADRVSRADATISGLRFDDLHFGTLAVSGEGVRASHNTRLSLSGEALTMEASVSGALRDGLWHETIATMQIASEMAGAWSLRKPADVVFGPDGISLDNTCLVEQASDICIAARVSGETTDTRIELTAFPLRHFNSQLPATLELGGGINGIANLQLQNQQVTGTGRLDIVNGVIRRASENDSDQYAITAFALDFDISPQQVSLETDVAVERWFTLRGRAASKRRPDAAVTAQIDANSEDISWITEFVPDLGGTTGKIELNATLSGSPESPRGSARLLMKNGFIRVPDMGLEITGLDAAFDGDPESVDVGVAIGALDGEMRLNGTARTNESGHWHYDLELNGTDFPLVRIPEAEADVSPALRLSGIFPFLDVTGTLLVPRVSIDVKRLPNSAASVSDDQIIVSPDGSPPRNGNQNGFVTRNVSGRVAIRLGDDISINGYGLRSKLSGGVDWTKERGSALGRADGTIDIEEGDFKAYGQLLQIEHGRIQFAGPVDNPNLSLRAVRPNLPVKAGVDVGGTVGTPIISLFSEPPQSDADTLAYVITGHPLDTASAGDAVVLTQAAFGLGSEQSAAITAQIQNRLGLDELSVKSGDTPRDTSLVAGKRLSPKLSVRTGFNPFDQLWSFFFNYKLTPRWSIEAESGERQGADLLYSIERERLFGP